MNNIMPYINYIQNVALQAKQSASQAFTKGAQQIGQLASYSVRHIKLIPQQMQDNQKVAIAVFATANTVVFLVMRFMLNRLDQRLENQNPDEPLTSSQRTWKHILLDGFILGGSVLSANLLLSKITEYALNKEILAIITAGTIVARILFNQIGQCFAKDEIPTPPPQEEVDLEEEVTEEKLEEEIEVEIELDDPTKEEITETDFLTASNPQPDDDDILHTTFHDVLDKGDLSGDVVVDDNGVVIQDITEEEFLEETTKDDSTPTEELADHSVDDDAGKPIIDEEGFTLVKSKKKKKKKKNLEKPTTSFNKALSLQGPGKKKKKKHKKK